MISLLVCGLLLGSVTQARVTFTHSEVLQQSDIPAVGDRAPFKCDNGCKAYTDLYANNLYITEYNAQSDAYSIVVMFSQMGGGTKQFLPEPYVLKAGKNYFIENRGEKNPTFVFYVVDSNAPNTNTPVMIIGDDWGNDLNGKNRMVTTLSSKYDSHRYNQFLVGYQKGYPRIYSTGFDAVAEQGCQPLYQAKSQESVSLVAITVFSPISTVDYGYEGDTNVHVKWNKDNSVTLNKESSTVFSSPGYVGCSYTKDHSYTSSLSKIEGGDDFVADSVAVNAVYYGVQPEETVHLNVDEMQLDFCGTGSYSWQYEQPFQFATGIQWERKTASSNWAVQIDFGTLPNTGKIGKVSGITCKADPLPTSTSRKPDVTTSSTSSISICSAIVLAIYALL